MYQLLASSVWQAESKQRPTNCRERLHIFSSALFHHDSLPSLSFSLTFTPFSLILGLETWDCVYVCVYGPNLLLSIPEVSARARSKRTHALCCSTHALFFPSKSISEISLWRISKRGRQRKFYIEKYMCVRVCVWVRSVLFYLS